MHADDIRVAFHFYTVIQYIASGLLLYALKVPKRTQDEQ